jgi:hypothetical protein
MGILALAEGSFTMHIKDKDQKTKLSCHLCTPGMVQYLDAVDILQSNPLGARSLLVLAKERLSAASIDRPTDLMLNIASPW